MTQYKTPGVYVQEIPSFPPSVAGVSTAVPAFIGYTETTNREQGKPPAPVRISALLDYTEKFGGAEETAFTVTVDADNNIESVSTPGLKDFMGLKHLMYHSLHMYFKQGGGPCYIISLGDYDATMTRQDFEEGLEVLKKEDEPTMILLVDAVNLDDIADYDSLCQAALAQCGELKDRFCVFDVLQRESDWRNDIQKFRDGIGTKELKYGAAYYPYLRTALNFSHTDESVEVTGAGADLSGDVTAEYETASNGIRIFYTYTGDAARPETSDKRAEIVKNVDASVRDIQFATTSTKLTVTLPKGTKSTSTTPAAAVNAWLAWKNEKNADNTDKNDARGFDIQKAGKGVTSVTPRQEFGLTYATVTTSGSRTYKLQEFQYDRTKLYNDIKARLDKERVVLPPSAIMAGVYAYIDNTTGVWKAPANVSLASVIEPMLKLNAKDQEDLNIDANAGKSINVIRAFTGKGNIVWGARTLMGNDNEWRYINVRRLFSYVEESVQKATSFAVFEPNTAITWLKVRAMIESFLEDLWRAGGLAGETKDQAYFVNLGLGATMTEQDVLEGRMNVEIGLAAVRPAEFIILKFSHKMQES